MLCNFIIYPQEIQKTSKVSDSEDHLGICTKSLNNSKSHSKLLAPGSDYKRHEKQKTL